MLKATFLSLYSLVFDENNNVKVCGRMTCQKLITCADQIEPNVSHGNVNTGVMDIQSLQKLKISIQNQVLPE